VQGSELRRIVVDCRVIFEEEWGRRCGNNEGVRDGEMDYFMVGHVGIEPTTY
jgi:hypothetical protein